MEATLALFPQSEAEELTTDDEPLITHEICKCPDCVASNAGIAIPDAGIGGQKETTTKRVPVYRLREKTNAPAELEGDDQIKKKGFPH